MSIDGQFGGRVTFEFDGKRIAPCEGDFVLDPANISTEARANQDGTAAYILKPKLMGCDVKLRHQSGINWRDIMLTKGNATIVEENNGRTHLFTGCRLVGDPKVNITTGEVDGLRIEGDQYQRLES